MCKLVRKRRRARHTECMLPCKVARRLCVCARVGFALKIGNCDSKEDVISSLKRAQTSFTYDDAGKVLGNMWRGEQPAGLAGSIAGKLHSNACADDVSSALAAEASAFAFCAATLKVRTSTKSSVLRYLALRFKRILRRCAFVAHVPQPFSLQASAGAGPSMP